MIVLIFLVAYSYISCLLEISVVFVLIPSIFLCFRSSSSSSSRLFVFLILLLRRRRKKKRKRSSITTTKLVAKIQTCLAPLKY